MKKLLFAAFAVAVCVAVTGCGKSDRERVVEALTYLEPREDKRASELEHFDKQPKEKQCEFADMAEYIMLLKKNSHGMLSDEQCKTLAGETLEGKSAAERKDLLEKIRAELKQK